MEFMGMDEPNWRKMMLTLIAITAALIVAISFLIMVRYLPPPKDPAARIYRRFTNAAGVAPQQGETPLSYAVRVAGQKTDIADETNNITSQYLDARYGPPDLAAIHKLKAAVSQFAGKR